MSNKQVTKVYTFNQFDHELRVGEINGEPWFVAKDVCKALNIAWNGNTTLAQIPDGWKGVLNFNTPGGNQDLTVISEAGLYKLAFRCQSSEIADAFTNKVASEILPSIRKTGRYEVGGASSSSAVVRHPRRSRSELVNAELLNLLWLIGESLRQGEIKEVALELGVSRVTVSKVLNGYARNPRVLMALYTRAKANRACGVIYHRPAVMAERLIEAESGDVVVQLPPVAYGKPRRGGQPGNQNARKWQKGGVRV